MQEFDETPLEVRKSSCEEVQQNEVLLDDEMLDLRTWTKICLLLALTLATLNGVDPVGII